MNINASGGKSKWKQCSVEGRKEGRKDERKKRMRAVHSEQHSTGSQSREQNHTARQPVVKRGVSHPHPHQFRMSVTTGVEITLWGKRLGETGSLSLIPN